MSLLSMGVSHHPSAFGLIVGEAGVGGVGGQPNGGTGGDGQDGYAALDLTTSYTTYDDLEGAPGGGGGGGGGGGPGNFGGGAGGKGGGGGHGIVISGDGVVLHNDGWSISGGKGGGGGGGGGGSYSTSAVSDGGRGGDGSGGEGGGAGGGGGGGADINPGGPDGSGNGGNGGNGGENGLPGGGDGPGADPYAGGGGGGGGTYTNGGSAGQGLFKSPSPGVGGPGGIAGGESGADGGGAAGGEGWGGGGGGGGAAGGAGGNGGPGVGFPGGPAGGAGGSSGHGVYVTGVNSVIINSGTISQGPVNQDAAIKYSATARDSTLVLQEGSQIIGLVDATESGGKNTLVLDGGSALAFDLGKVGGGIGGQYLGFNAFEKTSAGTWTLTGTPGQSLTPWTLSGGWLAIADEALLGDVAGGLTFNGGGLQLDAGLTLQRDIQMLGDGAIRTADGTVSVTQGTISGAGGLTKTGSGTLIIEGGNVSSGTTRIEDGVLRVGAGQTTGSLGTGSVLNNAVLVIDRADNLIMSNAISGAGDLHQSGSGTTTLTGPLSYTGITHVDNGMLVLDGTALGQAGHGIARVVGAGVAGQGLGLINGARLDGWIDGPSVAIDASSRWNVLTDASNPSQGNIFSTVNELHLAGSIAFAPPANWTNDDTGRTLSANNLVGAGGEVQLHLIPAGAGAVDYLTLTEGATGLTNLTITAAGGFGDPLSGNGLLVVKAGASTDNAFRQTPGQPAQGGAFNYVLVHGARDGAADLANNWYLLSDVRPEVSIYSQLGSQSLRQSELAVGTFNERMGATDTLARKVYPYAWARSLGALERRDGAARGIEQSQVAADSRLGGLQVGTDLYVANKGISRRSAGVFATAMLSSNDVDHYQASTRSTINAGRSEQTMYGLGAYYTWLDGKGAYADFVTQISRYGVKTQSRGAQGTSLQTSGWGAALSAEAGKAFDIGDESNGLRLEPQAQVMVQHVSLRDRDDDGGRVALPGSHALHSRVSLKLSKAWGESAETQSHGWLMLSYQHTLGKSSSSYASATQGDIVFENDLDGSRVGLTAGYDRRAGKNAFVNVQVNAGQGVGGTAGLRTVGGSIGIKYLF
ncbi:autotransporter outer membrane beta-barrel domain-containing protein [Achromobacter spanius]|uniref:autotransporter outer membrane beta-barrel domain-containing protein n=1 Tax=Achromobacter spanius TaxID=217203 RepID=UPI00380E24A7